MPRHPNPEKCNIIRLWFDVQEINVCIRFAVTDLFWPTCPMHYSYYTTTKLMLENCQHENNLGYNLVEFFATVR